MTTTHGRDPMMTKTETRSLRSHGDYIIYPWRETCNQHGDKHFHRMDIHRIYRQKLEELTALQTSCSSSISKQKTRLKDLKRTLQRYKRHTSREEAELIQQLGANVKERQNVFFDMEAYLPKKNGLYLNLVLGNVNVTLLSNQAKFAYKDEYEKFKLYLTIILLLGAVACRFVLHYRVTDEVFNFLLVWYYCTLTIRESILISNGSRIKGWWVSHHYVSTFLSGVMLTWPNGLIYQKFRDQFLAFSIFQKGFQSWMWRGLTFLLPFLFCGHVSPPGVCGYPLHWADLPGTEGLQGSPSLTSHSRAGPHGVLGLRRPQCPGMPKARAGIGPRDQHAQPQAGCPRFILGGLSVSQGQLTAEAAGLGALPGLSHVGLQGTPVG
ncbi:transmembrane protein 120B isoform X5 [Tursiops truncatus]|uniref:transmembrane protein 120B isoform X5 n=1 Tax=Tursiops truncatus TaxID=9739 RepID=UPI003CCF48A3